MPDPHVEIAASIGNAAVSVASGALDLAHSQVSSRKMLLVGSEEMNQGLDYLTERMPTEPQGPYVITDPAERAALSDQYMDLSRRRKEIRARADKSIASNVFYAQRDARELKSKARRFHEAAKTSSEEARAQKVKKDSINEILGSGDSGPPPEAGGYRGNTNPSPSAVRIDGAQQPFVPAARSFHDAPMVRPPELRHREAMHFSPHRAHQSQASVSGNPSQIPNTQALQESRYMYPTMPYSSTPYAASNEQYPGSSRQPNRAQYDGPAPREQMYMASPAEGRVGPSTPETYVPPFPGNNRQPAAGGYTTGYTGRDASGIGAQSVHVPGRPRGRTSHSTSSTTIPLPGRREASLVRPGPVQPQAARAADNFTAANAGRNDAGYGRSVTQPYYAQAGPAREYHQDVSGRERPRDTEERQDRHRVRQRDASREPRHGEDAPSGHRGLRRTHDRHRSSSHQARRDY